MATDTRTVELLLASQKDWASQSAPWAESQRGGWRGAIQRPTTSATLDQWSSADPP